MSTIPFDDFLAERLKNPEFAAHYLNSILDDGSPEEITDALKAILMARSGPHTERTASAAVTKSLAQASAYLLHEAGLRLHVQPAA